jgi:phosphoglycerate kinase
MDINKKTVADVWLPGKRALVRVDYNVPMDKEGNITDDTRIRATLPTIEYLTSQNVLIILASHLGRPKGEPNPKYSLAPVAKKLSQLLNGREVLLAPDCIGDEVMKMVENLKPQQILLLENLRFHAEEEKNDPEFSRQLASLADILINDAFGVSHRAHASVHGVTKYIPSVAGFLMEKEILFLGEAVHNPKRPLVAIIGGAKVSDKIGVVEHLLGKVDTLIIGGGMANTFLAAQGYDVGKSLVETDKIDLAKSIIEQAKDKNVKLLLPIDVVVADKFDASAEYKTVGVGEIPAEWMALDIGAATIKEFSAALSGAKTVVWNGPMGVFEFDNFAKGTEEIAKAVSASHARSIVGGGDSVAALEKLGLANEISHISTG